jgi:ribonucleotide reductase beta subunit family protein with ferritin-like domain
MINFNKGKNYNKLIKNIYVFDKSSKINHNDQQDNNLIFEQIDEYGVKYFKTYYDKYDKKTSQFFIDNIKGINQQIIKKLIKDKILTKIGDNQGYNKYEIESFELENFIKRIQNHLKKYDRIYSILLGVSLGSIPLFIFIISQ